MSGCRFGLACLPPSLRAWGEGCLGRVCVCGMGGWVCAAGSWVVFGCEIPGLSVLRAVLCVPRGLRLVCVSPLRLGAWVEIGVAELLCV